MKTSEQMLSEIRERHHARKIKREENEALNRRLQAGETVKITIGGPTIVSADDDLDLLLALLDNDPLAASR